MIYKRGNQWHMDATIRGERYRESLGTGDRREALNLEKKRIAEIQQGKAATAADRDFARLAFGDAADALLAERPGHVSERSIQFEKERLNPSENSSATSRIGKIRGDDIRAYQRARREATFEQDDQHGHRCSSAGAEAGEKVDAGSRRREALPEAAACCWTGSDK